MINNNKVSVEETDKLYLNRVWNCYLLNTIGNSWDTQKFNSNGIDTVNEMWKYLNMFFSINGHKAQYQIDVENNNRKEISFFQEGTYPNWDVFKTLRICNNLNELKIYCKNEHCEFILFTLLSLFGESFRENANDEECDESYIQKICGIRICPYKNPSIRLWLMDFTPKMLGLLLDNLKFLWDKLYKNIPFKYNVRQLVHNKNFDTHQKVKTVKPMHRCA